MDNNLTMVMTAEEAEKARQEVGVFVAKAQDLVIKNEMENTKALEMLAAYKKEIKRRKAMDVYTKAEAAKKSTAAAFKALTELMIDPLAEAVDIIAEKSGTFIKQENARRAELQRIEDEKAAAAQRKEDERIARLNAKAEAAGKPAPVITPKYIPPARTIAQVSAPVGTSLPKRWSAKVIDKNLFLQAVIAGEEPDYLVEIVMPELNARATACKVEGKEIAPGVIAESKIIVSSR